MLASVFFFFFFFFDLNKLLYDTLLTERPTRFPHQTFD